MRRGKIIIGVGRVLLGTVIIAWQNVTVEDRVTFGPGVTVRRYAAIERIKNHTLQQQVIPLP
ncbi:hypothetical protein [Erwinia sp. 198]|uniref:hypothetical protein n=1 Tax=Erwinia sp. 198 TaxID=2022746 RepID=UPI000F6712C0|nr:hypothetical protein [Erwinia sp. 198]RRZ96771.1 hypothetical protein EGK14_00240 [Erwinia sp. 198]